MVGSDGQVQRRSPVFVLRIHIRLRRNQRGDSGDMAPCNGLVQIETGRGGARRIGDQPDCAGRIAPIRPRLNQQGDNGGMTGFGGQVQRRLVVVVFHIQTRRRLNQQGDNRGMAVFGGHVQRRDACSGFRIHIRRCRNQRGGNGGAAVSGGEVQRRLPDPFLIHIRPMDGDEVIDQIQIVREITASCRG